MNIYKKINEMNQHLKELEEWKNTQFSSPKENRFTGLGKHQEDVIKDAVDKLWNIRSEIESDIGRISEETYEYYNVLIEQVESMLKELITIE